MAAATGPDLLPFCWFAQPVLVASALRGCPELARDCCLRVGYPSGAPNRCSVRAPLCQFCLLFSVLGGLRLRVGYPLGALGRFRPRLLSVLFSGNFGCDGALPGAMAAAVLICLRQRGGCGEGRPVRPSPPRPGVGFGALSGSPSGPSPGPTWVHVGRFA